MDRNTLIGLGLIGVILAIFTYVNQPDPEEYQRQQEEARKELEERQQLEEKREKQESEEDINDLETSGLNAEDQLPENWIVLLDEAGREVKDEDGRVTYRDTVAKIDTFLVESSTDYNFSNETNNNLKGETINIQNDKLFVELNTLGGGLTSVFLTEHQTYDDFEKNRGTDKINPLQLFDADKSTNSLVFPLDGEKFESKNVTFEIVNQSDEQVKLRHTFARGKYIEYTYTLLPESYKVNFDITIKGFEGEVMAENVQLDWKVDLLKTEKLLSEQRRTSTVFFREGGESYDYLSEFSEDEYSPASDIDWVAFKQSYFSAIMMPKGAFKKDGSNLKITDIDENDPRDSSIIRSYDALLTLNIDQTGNATKSIDWYFGPNDYYMLKQFDNGTENILNYGWGLFRWVNVYAIQPIFSWLASTGMSLGLAILFLTIIVKILLTPIQWKMYSSSAKMRILKPEIDELNKKYPNKEDSMKKQMEMMTLYKESGASPLAGCVPMLIQMPILFAVFRFFPSTFELRQKSFLWAEDLSSYDSIANLSFEIPFYGDHISLFTLLMAGTTLIYTVLNSSNMQQPSQPGMPNMKVIMYIFPIMMIFFFNNFASGLSYYYFISTLMSILTMVMIKKFFVDEDKLKAKMAARKEDSKKNGGKKGKRSKFQERLEEMQRQKQEKMKNRKK